MHRIIYSIVFSLLLGVGFLFPQTEVLAQTSAANGGPDKYGTETTARTSGLNEYGNNLPLLVGQIIGTALSMIGVLFFGSTVWSGYLWFFSGVSPDKKKQAQEMLTGSVVGLVIVTASYAITNFMFTSLSI